MLHRTFALIGMLMLISTGVFAQNNAPTKANVILIMADDLNDYLGNFGGHPQAITPNLDKLASMGVQFNNHQSNAPVCMPSRNSLFTGVYPHDSKDFGWTPQHKQAVLKHNKPIHQLFQENGYYTLGTGKLMHGGQAKLWNEWGFNRKQNHPFYSDGKDIVVPNNVPAPFRDIGPIDGSYGPVTTTAKAKKRGEPGWVLGYSKAPLPFDKQLGRTILPDERHALWAVDKIGQLAKDSTKQPFFMGVGFARPHTPLHAPQAFFNLYPLEQLQLPKWLENDRSDSHYHRLFPSKMKGLRYYRDLLASYNDNRELAVKTYLQAYLACVSYMDAQLGKIVVALEAEPELLANTIIVFTSDHGWQMGEKQYLFKNSPWEESSRIPLIIKTTNRHDAGKQVQQPTSLVDIYPSLMTMAQLTGEHKLNNQGAKLGGHPLTTLIDKPDGSSWTGPQGALTIIGNAFHSTQSKEVAEQHYSYRTERYRYINYSDGSEELYDHHNDPYEWHNIAKIETNLTIKAQLKGQIEAIIGQELTR